jgi:N-acetylglucosamine malate deacetylase 1
MPAEPTGQNQMGLSNPIKSLLHSRGIHLRRWLTGILSYPRYLGYIKPALAEAGDAEFGVRRKMLARAWAPRQLTAPLGKRLLALCPHPDDESIGAGGLLLAHRGIAEIHLVCLTDGAGGGSLEDGAVDPATLANVRGSEFRKTAAALNAASLHHLDYRDCSVPCTPADAARLRSIVSAIRPDVVLLPWFLDAHDDHRQTNLLYAKACSDLDCVVLGYEIWSMLEPNAYFDITDHLSGKLSLIANYASQLRTVDYASYAFSLARVRGYQAAMRPARTGAAEAFVALPNHEYCDLVFQLYGAAKQLDTASEGARFAAAAEAAK